MGEKSISCTPDRNCHTFCLGDKIASHPGVLTQAKKITQNLEINQILGVVVQEKESNMVFCSRRKFPTLGMTVLSGTSASLGSAQHGHPLGWKLPSLFPVPVLNGCIKYVVQEIQYSHVVFSLREDNLW